MFCFCCILTYIYLGWGSAAARHTRAAHDALPLLRLQQDLHQEGHEPRPRGFEVPRKHISIRENKKVFFAHFW